MVPTTKPFTKKYLTLMNTFSNPTAPKHKILIIYKGNPQLKGTRKIIIMMEATSKGRACIPGGLTKA